MHYDIHLRLHEIRATELRRDAGTLLPLTEPPPGPRLRSGAASGPGVLAGLRTPLPLRLRLRLHVGWTLVEVGLRLVQQPGKRLRTESLRG
ncbi:hypothetical protein KBZ10_04000 [Streptomyces sp. F63]|uniref:hypothetical protein n=1 Tax=Streptomyces sp. F63 TaxID=2824887 RepID=UPI001B39063B|nr:hypothetical protein [Streptomyces sp. F63]MBQ0983698.1 hypothetical protein [Streptomyces sp. F63]